MNQHAPICEAEDVPHPLFTERRAGECAWPLWGERTPLEQKRCCGAPVRPGSKTPYCREHLDAQAGAGTRSEQDASRALSRSTRPV